MGVSPMSITAVSAVRNPKRTRGETPLGLTGKMPNGPKIRHKPMQIRQ
jgi:hypothetical protein